MPQTSNVFRNILPLAVPTHAVWEQVACQLPMRVFASISGIDERLRRQKVSRCREFGRER